MCTPMGIAAVLEGHTGHTHTHTHRSKGPHTPGIKPCCPDAPREPRVHLRGVCVAGQWRQLPKPHRPHRPHRRHGPHRPHGPYRPHRPHGSYRTGHITASALSGGWAGACKCAKCPNLKPATHHSKGPRRLGIKPCRPDAPRKPRVHLRCVCSREPAVPARRPCVRAVLCMRPTPTERHRGGLLSPAMPAQRRRAGWACMPPAHVS